MTLRGNLMAVDTNTGAIQWKTSMVPDGYTGGSIWGSSPAVDTKRGDGWGALDANRRQILWQTLNPAFGSGMGPVSAANGALLACSTDPNGHVYSMSSASGASDYCDPWLTG